MTLVKYNPTRRTFMPGFANLLDEFFNEDVISQKNVGTVPSVNIRETEDSYFIDMAAPGMKKDDFKVEADNHQLIISSFKEDRTEEKDAEGKFTMREFNYHSFRRSFTLPEGANTDKISASYKDGVLNIGIAKKEEAKEKPVRTIKIG
jgi:HSP20 family protein